MTPRTRPQLARWFLPACETCNNQLDHRFEQPAKAAVARMFSDPYGAVLDAEESAAVALWFVKTWVFLRHPALTAEDGAYQERLQPWDGAPDSLWSWTVNDAAPPAGLSMWLSRAPLEGADRERWQVCLPSIVDVDGVRVDFRGFQFAIEDFVGELIYHPGWEFEHPLEPVGAVRLWPRSSSTGVIDLSQLHAPASELRFTDAGPTLTLRPGENLDGLPALSVRADFDYEAAMSRCAGWTWGPRLR